MQDPKSSPTTKFHAFSYASSSLCESRELTATVSYIH